MGRQKSSRSLVVALNGHTVGSLTRAADGATRFKYAGEWLAWENAFPVSRSIPLREETFTGSVTRAFFENLLPDRRDVRERIASTVGADGTEAFPMLAALGRDCVGALQFLPEGESPEPPCQPDGRVLTEKQIGDRIRSLATTPLGVKAGDGAFRISLAGAQDKTALLYHDDRWLEPTGTTPTTHILKPQIGEMPLGDGIVDMSASVQNEHYCMTLCRNLGLQVAKTSILKLPGDIQVLSITRFDRRFDKQGRLLRVPQEDMCQALGVPPTRKYEHQGGPGALECLELLKSSDKPDRDQRAFMRSQIVFWLIAAVDGHAKNFSLFLNPRGGFEMTPLYDVLSVQWQHDREQIATSGMQLAMSIGEKGNVVVEHIAPRHFENSAHAAGLGASALQRIMRELIEALPDALVKTRDAMDESVPTAMMDSIAHAAERRSGQLMKFLEG